MRPLWGGLPREFAPSLIAPGSAATTVSALLNTSSAGAKSGTVNLSLTSDGTGTSGLGATSLASQAVTITGTMNNYANPMFALLSGSGTVTQSDATHYLLNFGQVNRNSGSPAANVGEGNGAAGPADTMSGSFVTSGVPASAFTLTGFSSFSGVTSGQTRGGESIAFNSSQPNGTYTGTLEFDPSGQNASGYSGALSPVFVTLQGQVVPEPGTGLLAAAIAAAGLLRRRRRGG